MTRGPRNSSRYSMGNLCTISIGVGKVWIPIALSKAMASKIGVNQGSPLSSTIFGLYKDEIYNYIDRLGGSRVSLTRVAIAILLIVCLWHCVYLQLPKGPTKTSKYLKVILYKWKICQSTSIKTMIVFTTTRVWVKWLKPEFFLEIKRWHTHNPTHN